MTNAMLIAKVKESIQLGAKAAKDAGETKWTTERHNVIVAATIAKAIKEGWQPTPAEVFAFIQATYNHSAWRQKFEEQGLFQSGRKSADRDIAGLLGQLESEGVV